MEEQAELVGKAFVDHYYHMFDTDRSSLSSLYQPTSMLTFEGQKTQGVEEIVIKLTQLQFDQCRHLISTVDSQPSLFTGGIIVFVSGNLQLSGEEHPLRCFTCFQRQKGAILCKMTYFASIMVDFYSFYHCVVTFILKGSASTNRANPNYHNLSL
ncbi:hypothetical protein HHK36_005595 [Tetracentron sinense]|uniref:NTF2 domain-containing protein n=1 Tax=Tetracentron sinense TaxID=13715 RepID=A0A835DMG5_TETSI|nr:hypothetical protein HHK36_005595 [Tetracentron sinense]